MTNENEKPIAQSYDVPNEEQKAKRQIAITIADTHKVIEQTIMAATELKRKLDRPKTS